MTDGGGRGNPVTDGGGLGSPATDAGGGGTPATDGRRLDLGPDQVGRDLVALVLTVVELLRQLMERQAIRRVEQGDLSEEQIDEIGTTLMLLDERMTELCEQHGLRPEDLNLDLGPLGTLLPRD
ncbi:hypothetical protein GCM10010321_51070 [Streptomyces chartreusis]|nr:hypothetical protein GCM10010321_51070 [Streptomyces chartreusis]